MCRANYGEKNGSWKGDNVKYKGLHMWVKKHWPTDIPTRCQKCGLENNLSLCNVSPCKGSDTYNRDFKNWWWGCHKEHTDTMMSEERRHKLGSGNRGRKFSEEWIKNLRGRTPWNKGKTGVYSTETRKRMSETAKLDPSRKTRMLGDNNPMRRTEKKGGPNN